MHSQPIRDRKRLSILVLASALIVFALAPAHAGRRMTSDFRTTETRPMTIAVLPAHAEFIKAKAVMTEEMVEECKALEQSATAWIERLLDEKGYDAKIVTLDDVSADSELAELVHGVNDRYSEVWARIVRQPKGVQQDRYELGIEAQELAAFLDVDGLVVPRVQAVAVTMGKAFMTSMVSFGQASAAGYASIDLAVVDGKSGDIEAYFFFTKTSRLKPLTKKPDKVMMDVTEGALKRYPESTEVLKPKGPDSDEEDEEMAEEQEAALLAELEALLGPEEPTETEETDDMPTED